MVSLPKGAALKPLALCQFPTERGFYFVLLKVPAFRRWNLSRSMQLRAFTLRGSSDPSCMGRRAGMDEDRIKGTATNIGGKVKDAAGGLLGDSKT